MQADGKMVAARSTLEPSLRLACADLVTHGEPDAFANPNLDRYSVALTDADHAAARSGTAVRVDIVLEHPDPG